MVRENSTGLSMNPLSVLVPAVLLVSFCLGVTVVLDRAAAARSGGADRHERLTRIGRLA
jgi:hypothetical protein